MMKKFKPISKTEQRLSWLVITLTKYSRQSTEENILGLMVLKVSIHGHLALPFLGQLGRMWWTKPLTS